MNIPEPDRELTLHSFINLNSSPKIKPKVIGSVLLDVM